MKSAPIFAVGFLGLFAGFVHAQEWNQWRGPQRDGTVSAESSPRSWPEQYGVAWQTEVGEGYSSPVVDGQTAFVHARNDPDEVVMAIDLETGEVKWKQPYPAAFDKNQYARDMAKGPNATPLVDSGKLFTVGVTGMVAAWDTETGQSIWGVNYSSIVDTSKLFCGTSASPLIVDGRLIIQVGSDVHGGQILGIDPNSGKELWKWTGPGPGYSSAIVIDFDNTRQIVTMTENSIVGLDASSGKELWTIPFPDEWAENIVTPLWTGSLLIISGIRQGTHAFQLAKVGDAWKPTEVWENRQVAMYMSSPVLSDGTIFCHSARSKGQFVALDAASGQTRWASPGRDAEHASVVLTPQHVVWLTNDGKLIVSDRSANEYKPAQTYQLTDSKTWSMPVLLGDDLLIRDDRSLIRLRPQQ